MRLIRRLGGASNIGSNKLLLFAIAEEIDKNYTNVQIIVAKLRLNKVDFVFASDLKLINCLLGPSLHSGKHACPYCEGEMTLALGVLSFFWEPTVLAPEADGGRRTIQESRRHHQKESKEVHKCGERKNAHRR